MKKLIPRFQEPFSPLQNVAVAESTKIIKPTIVQPKKVQKNDLSNESWEQVDNERTLNLYPNLRNDKYVQEFYQYDYAPRFQRQNKFAPQQYVNAAKNIYKTTPINIYYEDSGVGGYKTGGERRKFNNAFLDFGNRVLLGVTDKPASIYLNKNYKLNRPTIIHELAHAFRQGTLGLTGDRRFSSESNPIYSQTHNIIGTRYEGSGYTSKEEDMLHNTYNMSHYLLDYDELYEKGTTNTEVRFRLWKQLYDKLGRRPTLQETDNYIKNYNGENLKTIIRDANGYGRQMYENGLNVNDVKNTLINVAQNNPLKEEEDAYVSYARKGGRL